MSILRYSKKKFITKSDTVIHARGLLGQLFLFSCFWRHKNILGITFSLNQFCSISSTAFCSYYYHWKSDQKSLLCLGELIFNNLYPVFHRSHCSSQLDIEFIDIYVENYFLAAFQSSFCQNNIANITKWGSIYCIILAAQVPTYLRRFTLGCHSLLSQEQLVDDVFILLINGSLSFSSAMSSWWIPTL